MQALFLCLLFALHAAGFVEAHLLAVTTLVAVVVTLLAIAAGDLVRLAQAAFHVGAGHAAANFLADDRLASLVARYPIAAAVVLLADNDDLRRGAGACAGGWFGQGHGFAAARRRVVRTLQLRLLLGGAAVAGEGDMAIAVFTAEHTGGEWGMTGVGQGSAQGCIGQSSHRASSLTYAGLSLDGYFSSASVSCRCRPASQQRVFTKQRSLQRKQLFFPLFCRVQSPVAVLSSAASAPPGLVEYHHGLTQ